MKKYITLPIDFSSLITEVLDSLAGTIELETIDNQMNRFAMLTPTADELASSGTGDTISSMFPTIDAVLEGHPIEVTCLARRPVNDAMPFPYSIMNHDQIIIPMKDADSCTFTVFEVAPEATLQNPRVPVGVSPNVGIYDPEYCSVIETFDITSPIFIKAGTTWMIETNTKDKLAHFLLITSPGGSNDSYFSE